jgi:hypothetical protein
MSRAVLWVFDISGSSVGDLTPSWELLLILPDFPYFGVYLSRSITPYHHSGTTAHQVFQKELLKLELVMVSRIAN